MLLRRTGGSRTKPAERLRSGGALRAVACGRLGLSLLALLALTPTADARDTIRARESTLKAAYLYQLANFVDWPEDREESTEPIRVCILGEDPFGAAIDALEGQRAKGRQLALERFRTLDEARGCHVLFISASEAPRLDRILDQLQGESVLTVGDSADFARAGGMIGFVVRAEKLRMEINLNAAEDAGLRISAKLLELSQIVDRGRTGMS